MRIRRPRRDAATCALCPRVTHDVRRLQTREGNWIELCFTCYQRARRNGGVIVGPVQCVGYEGNGCTVSDVRLLRDSGHGLRCLNCAMLARLGERQITAA